MTSAAATTVDVVEHCDSAFLPSPQTRIGAEVEWLVFHRADRSRHVEARTTAQVASGELPAGGSVSVEPGGQLELSTKPFGGPAALLAAIDADTQVLVERFARQGLDLVPLGFDTTRPPLRSLDAARYEAMERYFAGRWPAGIEMMTRTASLQVNIDLGPDPGLTWRRAHRLAPYLAAMFANSPSPDGAEGSLASHRQRLWAAIDPTRTSPVGPDPGDWLRYVLNSLVMLRLGPGSDATPTAATHTLAELLSGHDAPTLPELDLHITTLFPPVRPRGYLELRMIDAVPAAGRSAAIAATWALLTCHSLDADIAEICERISDPWSVVLDLGLADGRIRQASIELLDLAAAQFGDRSGELAAACIAWRSDRVASGWVPAVAAPVEPRR